MLAVLNFHRSTVKHALQNIQNDCHQWLSHSFRVYQIRFRLGLRLGPRWGSWQRSPISPSWFKGHLLVRGGGRGKGEVEGRESKERRTDGRGREGKVRRRPPLRKFLDPPLISRRKFLYVWNLIRNVSPMHIRLSYHILHEQGIRVKTKCAW